MKGLVRKPMSAQPGHRGPGPAGDDIRRPAPRPGARRAAALVVPPRLTPRTAPGVPCPGTISRTRSQHPSWGLEAVEAPFHDVAVLVELLVVGVVGSEDACLIRHQTDEISQGVRMIAAEQTCLVRHNTDDVGYGRLRMRPRSGRWCVCTATPARARPSRCSSPCPSCRTRPGSVGSISSAGPWTVCCRTSPAERRNSTVVSPWATELSRWPGGRALYDPGAGEPRAPGPGIACRPAIPATHPDLQARHPG